MPRLNRPLALRIRVVHTAWRIQAVTQNRTPIRSVIVTKTAS
jgi:hypothetical protein